MALTVPIGCCSAMCRKPERLGSAGPGECSCVDRTHAAGFD
jgi:hypothetical protein